MKTRTVEGLFIEAKETAEAITTNNITSKLKKLSKPEQTPFSDLVNFDDAYKHFGITSFPPSPPSHSNLHHLLLECFGPTGLDLLEDGDEIGYTWFKLLQTNAQLQLFLLPSSEAKSQSEKERVLALAAEHGMHIERLKLLNSKVAKRVKAGKKQIQYQEDGVKARQVARAPRNQLLITTAKEIINQFAVMRRRLSRQQLAERLLNKVKDHPAMTAKDMSITKGQMMRLLKAWEEQGLIKFGMTL